MNNHALKSFRKNHTPTIMLKKSESAKNICSLKTLLGDMSQLRKYVDVDHAETAKSRFN